MAKRTASAGSHGSDYKKIAFTKILGGLVFQVGGISFSSESD